MTGHPSLRETLQQYLSLRRALRFKLKTTGRLLGQFVDYLEAQRATTLTVERALAWATLPAGASTTWHAIRLSMVRGFAAYLHGLDATVTVPPADLLRHGNDRVTPYLYSDTEIRALITAASALRPAFRAATHQALIGLLAASGIRIGEAIALDTDDLGPADIPENQLLLAAGSRLQRLPGLPADTAKLIRHTLARLAGVSRLTPGHPLPAWQPTRLNQRYHTALWLADLVLRGASYELDDGTPIRVDGLLLRMWQVFEDFVTVAVVEALHPYGGRSQRQDKRHHLDHARRVQLKPDLVYYRADDTGRETPAAILDAKYKIETIAGGDNPDLYQMLAYSTVLRLDRGHLVYAKGPVESVRHHLYGSDVTVLQHALDLDQHPSDLLGQIDDIAAQVAATSSPGGLDQTLPGEGKDDSHADVLR